LVDDQNEDGGWGDTDRSFSNISTTMLCRAAFHICGEADSHRPTLNRCDFWLNENYGSTPEELAEAIRRRYGKDRTFAVPILTMCALAGLVNWDEIPRLPFELACLPQSWYRFARLPVVSYALPALIAIGQVVHHHRRKWNPLTTSLRWLARRPSLKVLRKIQPSTGGYLEATPLTSFVVMSLAVLRGNKNAQQVMEEGVRFIERSVRPDGSWAIDSNLSVWVTTLTVNALDRAKDLKSLPEKQKLMEWLLAQQSKSRHPFTGADPGGWGWSHLAGSVPDCDDTPGAKLALQALLDVSQGEIPESFGREVVQSVELSEKWIEGLQNRDGGWPTFCRGWGKLPFDRSGCDLTAHVLRNPFWWNTRMSRPPTESSVLENKSFRRGFDYLKLQQSYEGSWLPLWFGNQHTEDESNPVYGTARVLAAYQSLDAVTEEIELGLNFLIKNQNPDGGWGGALGTPSSIEETALVVEIFAVWSRDFVHLMEPLEKGVDYLCSQVEKGGYLYATPIGFYFAKLWYYEKLYPMIFATAALGAALRLPKSS
jgi:squalene-hopene/tetraprenyl-beta-curcumene cyclase